MCEKLSQANVLSVVVEAIRVTALWKSDGGVRRDCCRFVSTACRESVHTDPLTGWSVFDQISWWHIAARFCRACSNGAFFFPHLWEDSAECTQSAKVMGASKDISCPSSLLKGSTVPLDAVQEEVQEREVLLAFHDDIHVVTPAGNDLWMSDSMPQSGGRC